MGLPRSGKDTFASVLVEEFGFSRAAFADAIRSTVYEINPYIVTASGYLREIVDKLGWDIAKEAFDEVREWLKKIGTEAGRNVHGSDCWVDIVKRRIEARPSENWVITDVRFENEVKLVSDRRGMLIALERSSSIKSNHVSDQLDLRKFADAVLFNEGTVKDLRGMARSVFSHFKSR